MLIIVIPGGAMEPARVARGLVTIISMVTCQYSSFLSPLNDAGVGASQVIFLPSLSSHQSVNREQRNIRFPDDDISDYSNIEAVVDRMSSRVDLVDDDVIDYADKLTVAEDHNEDGMTGSYAYMRNQ